ncbi:threonine--tRNA ligase, partial [bacterium]|nr:threonine--tRNA ligase [bacterium]
MEDKDLKVLRHSAAHLAAHAVLELFPDTILTIGPATETGFFYDMQPKVNFKEADLQIITQRMQEIVKRNLPLTHEQMPKDQARTLFKNNPFKLELIDNLEGETVGIARQGDFYDLCRGGHVTHTGMLKHFILTGISGSYWRADRNGTPLQRISGTAFYTEQDLKAYLQRVEDAEKYDHRKLGKEMDLFSFQDEGVGFPFFHPKGKTVLTIMQNAMRKEWKNHNYQEIQTPTMLDSCLWQQSGHYAHYKKNMYFCEVEDKEYAVKPMNCPGSILVYKHRPRSYKELPLK